MRVIEGASCPTYLVSDKNKRTSRVYKNCYCESQSDAWQQYAKDLIAGIRTEKESITKCEKRLRQCRERLMGLSTEEGNVSLSREGKLVVKCGICGKPIEPVMLSKPIPITDRDKENKFGRDRSFNCCQRSWLIATSPYRYVDCGPARF